MSVTTTIMRWHEPTKERVERTTLGKTAIEIPEVHRSQSGLRPESWRFSKIGVEPELIF